MFMPKSVNLYNEGFIDPDRVKQAVYTRIDFELPEKHWDAISNAFAECWNNKIGLGNWVHEQQIETFIQKELNRQHILIEHNRIEIIVSIINDYITLTRGYLETP